MKIDPTDVVPQSNRRTDSGLGIPYESSYITITPDQPSNLMGSTLAVSAPTTNWGSTITVTAQIRNAGAGASPATRALLALTPTGTLPTWPNDVSIGISERPGDSRLSDREPGPEHHPAGQRSHLAQQHTATRPSRCR